MATTRLGASGHLPISGENVMLDRPKLVLPSFTSVAAALIGTNRLALMHERLAIVQALAYGPIPLVSPNYIAFTTCPMLCDWERVKKGGSYFIWDPSLPVMVAVIPRAAGVAGLRWFTGPVLGMETHTINAWEDGSKLHLEHFFTRSG